jgi:nitrogen regulatory protein P-II 1
MKKIEAIIKPFKLDAVKEALRKEKIRRITVSEVRGAGIQQGQIKQYRGVQYIEDSVEVKIEIFAEDDEADRLAQTIVTALRTGDLCDGEVTILPVERSIRVRFGKCS